MKRGFTLIELLVGIAVFSLILGSVIGIFISAIQLQRDFLKKQEETHPLTLPGLVIEELKFKLQGESSADNLQPRVTIFLKIGSPLKIELQTTISQRNLDI